MKNKKRKIIIWLIIIGIFVVCMLPIPKKINRTFQTVDQNGKAVTFTVNGIYSSYLIFSDRFDGILIDEKGIEYKSVDKQELSVGITDTDEEDMILLSFYHLDVDAQSTSFATVYLDENMKTACSCVFSQ